MRFSQTLAGAVSFIALLLVACSSPAPSTSSTHQGETGGDDTKETKKGGTTPSKANNTASTPKPTGATGPAAPVVGTGQCAGKGNSDACYTCCETLTPEIKKYEAADVAIQKEYQTCACAAARCAEACKTSYCAAGADPDADSVDEPACNKCLDSTLTDTCDTQTQPKSDANDATPGGVAETQCIADAKCEEMENQESGDDDDDDDNAATP